MTRPVDPFEAMCWACGWPIFPISGRSRVRINVANKRIREALRVDNAAVSLLIQEWIRTHAETTTPEKLAQELIETAATSDDG